MMSSNSVMRLKSNIAILNERIILDVTQCYSTKIRHSQIFVTQWSIVLHCITSHRVSIIGLIYNTPTRSSFTPTRSSFTPTRSSFLVKCSIMSHQVCFWLYSFYRVLPQNYVFTTEGCYIAHHMYQHKFTSIYRF